MKYKLLQIANFQDLKPFAERIGKVFSFLNANCGQDILKILINHALRHATRSCGVIPHTAYCSACHFIIPVRQSQFMFFAGSHIHLTFAASKNFNSF